MERSGAAGRGRSHRRRLALIETTTALAILLAVALASSGGAPRAAPVPASALATWGRSAVPVITSLIDDVRAIETHTAPAADVSILVLGADYARFHTDLISAQHLRAPPAGTGRSVWTSAVVRLSEAGRTLRAAATTLDPAAIALAHQRFAVAGAGLLQVGQALTSSG